MTAKEADTDGTEQGGRRGYVPSVSVELLSVFLEVAINGGVL